jgi:hypothetical protein
MGVLSTIFEIFASFFHMLHFQRTMNLYQLAVNSEGEKMVIPT